MMDDNPQTANDDLVVVHADSEQLLRWRRIGTDIVYGSIVVSVVGFFICVAQNSLKDGPTVLSQGALSGGANCRASWLRDEVRRAVLQ